MQTPLPSPSGGASGARRVGRGACWAVALTRILKDPRPGPRVHRRRSRLPRGARGRDAARGQRLLQTPDRVTLPTPCLLRNAPAVACVCLSRCAGGWRLGFSGCPGRDRGARPARFPKEPRGAVLPWGAVLPRGPASGRAGEQGPRSLPPSPLATDFPFPGWLVDLSQDRPCPLTDWTRAARRGSQSRNCTALWGSPQGSPGRSVTPREAGATSGRSLSGRGRRAAGAVCGRFWTA